MIHVVARMELNPGCQEKMLAIMPDAPPPKTITSKFVCILSYYNTKFSYWQINMKKDL